VEARKKGGRNRTKEQSCQALADCPARRGGLSALTTWTVRPGAADSPQGPRRRSGQEPRTVRKSQQNHQRRTGKNGLSARTRRTVRYRSSDRPQTDCNKNLKQNPIENEGKQEHDEHVKNWAEHALADGPPGTRRLSAPYGQKQKQLDPAGQLLQHITGSPKR
jgi:hypothetical protein